jgi:hypothetical protein
MFKALVSPLSGEALPVLGDLIIEALHNRVDRGTIYGLSAHKQRQF